MNDIKSGDESSRWKKTSIWLLVGYVVLSLAAIPLAMFRFPYGLIVYLVALLGGAVYLVRWHARNSAFHCKECGHVFTVSAMTLTMSPHMGFQKLLNCPRCGKNSWCEFVSRTVIDPATAGPVEANRAEIRPNRSLYRHIAWVMAVYALLWVITLILYPMLPETVPTHFGATLEPDAWGSRSSIFLLPLIGAVMPLLHAAFCLYAARKGYRSPVYILITGSMIFSLMILIALQFLVLAEAA